MLTEVKNQIKVTILSIKYATMREMLNKASFLTNVLFMILNNASFILQWIILYSLKDNVGGYTLNQVMILWGLAASTYGFSHFFFAKATSLSDTITNGKLDAYLVQPKNVLISAITSDVSPAALGDMIYGIIMIFVSGITLSGIFIYYELSSIIYSFLITAVIFGVFAFIGFTTKLDLTKIGSYLIIGLFGVILCTIVNIFLKNDVLYLIASIVCVIVFIGMTAYDVQKIKQIENSGVVPLENLPIYGALQLYLDFINLFIEILKFFGKRND